MPNVTLESCAKMYIFSFFIKFIAKKVSKILIIFVLNFNFCTFSRRYNKYKIFILLIL